MAKRRSVRTRVVTVSRRAVSRKKGGGLSSLNLRRLAIKGATGVAAGLVTTFVLSRFAPNFADEGGIIVSSLSGGSAGTILWTLLGRRLMGAVQGAFGTTPFLGAGTQVGL